MICPKSLYDGIYQPYALSNAALTNNSSYNTNNGVKNYLPINSGVTTGAQYVFDWVAKDIPAGQYIISFSTATTSGAVAIEFGDGNTASYNRTGYRVVTLPSQSEEVTVGANTHYVRIYANVALTMSDIMLRPASIPDPTYQPYALPNTAITPILKECVDNGVKNIFDFDSWYNSLTGATRATKTATTNGITLTATGNDSYTTPQINGYHIPVKPNTSYTVTLDSSDSNGQLVFLENDGFSKVYVCETGTKTLTFTTSATADRLSVRFGVPTSGNTSTITNIMVQLASISDTTYQPYALSNAELTAGKVDRGEQFTSNTAKTYTVENDKTYMLTVVSFGNSGVFLLHKYANETDTRIYTVYKSTNFDSAVTIAATASSNNVVITPNSTWFFSTISCL